MTWIEYVHSVPQVPLAIPAGFSDVTLAGIAQHRVHALTKHYLSTPQFTAAVDAGIAPLIVGRVGTYKTYAACFIARVLTEVLGATVDYFDVSTEMPRIDREWFTPYATRRIDFAARAPFTIVDDFSLIRAGRDRDLSVFAELVNRRYAARLPTLFTANVTLSADLEAVYGAPVMRRIYERTKGFALNLI